MTRTRVRSALRPKARRDWLVVGYRCVLQTAEPNLKYQVESELVPWLQEEADSRVHSPRGSTGS